MGSTVLYLRRSHWSGLGFMALLFALHFIKPEIEPSWNFISEYQVGRFGWLMQLAFFSLALSCIFMVVGLWRHINIFGKIGLVMLLISACGMLIAAIFKTDPLNTAPELVTQEGKLHQIGAMLDQVPFGAAFVTLALFRKKEWKLNRILLTVLLGLTWFGFVYFVGSVQAQFPADGKFGPNVLVGWQNRVMIATQALWLTFISKHIQHAIAESLADKQQPASNG